MFNTHYPGSSQVKEEKELAKEEKTVKYPQQQGEDAKDEASQEEKTWTETVKYPYHQGRTNQQNM